LPYLTDRTEAGEPRTVPIMDAALREDPFKIRLQIVGGGTARVGENGAVIVTPNATPPAARAKPTPAPTKAPPPKRPIFANMIDVEAGKRLNADRANPQAAMAAKLQAQRVQQQAALQDFNKRNRERWAAK
jgi:hypothetical protein